MNKKVILIGNPNVGKSTIFNTLTGLNQHTGNWSGKTVDMCKGTFKYQNNIIDITDLPGVYSLNSYTEEEKVTTNYLKNELFDIAIIVIDATNLEKNLNLVLETLEITKKVILVLNIIDEASRKGIIINSKKLSNLLDVPVVLTDASKNILLNKLKDTIINYNKESTFVLKYPSIIENFLVNLDNKERYNKLTEISQNEIFKEEIITHNIYKSKEIFKTVVTLSKDNYNKKDIFLDKLLTNKLTGILIMFLFLFLSLFITISLSNYPSTFLFNLFNNIESNLFNILEFFLPINLVNLLVFGIYKTTTWIISVMLPPMMIFFILFTILEEYGILPRIAFNMDYLFSKCNSSGKQCLTMLMGFGCNAVGVSGTKIIESKKEKLIAILTNVFMPCNGRFPTIIALITVFLVENNYYKNIISAFYLTIFILLSILITFITSKILSKTVLKNCPSSNILELPSYRMVSFKKLIKKTIFEKVLVILKKTFVISFISGFILYLIANISINNESILIYLTRFLNDFGIFLGVDGTIILAFIVGIPANEIVIPVLLMGYLSTNALTNYENLEFLKNVLVDNGWNILTVLNFIILTIFHFPCFTTILTIKKETNSLKWTLFSILLPFMIGIILCLILKFIYLLII